MTSLSVTTVLIMLNDNFLLELLESFSIIDRSIFQDLDKSFLLSSSSTGLVCFIKFFVSRASQCLYA